MEKVLLELRGHPRALKIYTVGYSWIGLSLHVMHTDSAGDNSCASHAFHLAIGRGTSALGQRQFGT